jgi:hypothetical protein
MNNSLRLVQHNMLALAIYVIGRTHGQHSSLSAAKCTCLATGNAILNKKR